MENQEERRCYRKQRVVLFPLPFQGHVNPMLQLANILYSNGFSITIIHTKFNSVYTSNYPHFTFKPVLDNNSSEDTNLAKLSSKGVGDLISGIILLNQCGSDSLCQELEKLLIASKQQEEPIVCLITDALWYFTQSVADSLKLPRLVLRTSSLFCVNVYNSIPILDDQGYFNQVESVFDEGNTNVDLKNIMSPNEETDFKKVKGSQSAFVDLEERVPEIPLLKLKDILNMRVKGQKDPLAKLLANMLKQTKASSGIIWNSFKELEEPECQKIRQDFPVPSFLIGPFHKYFPASLSSLLEPDRSCMSWLHYQSPNSVLYISFGSAAQLNKHDFLEVAHGVANSKQPFLWVMRPGFVKGSEWIEQLPNWFVNLVAERGCIVKWAPQQEVLAHQATGAFWTHNGWNSTLESICEGVPMICSPFWGDQPLDARYVSDVLKVGVYLENGWEREEITSAIKRVMVEEESESFRERASRLKDKVNFSLSKGGSSFEYLQSLISYISSF